MQTKALKFHYAWVNCIAGAVLFFITVGLSGNSYSVYQPTIAEVFCLTQTQLSFLNTCRQISGLLAVSVVGIYYRHVNLKRGLIIGASLASAAFIVLGFAKSYPVLIAGCLMIGTGSNLCGMVAISILIDRWFQKKLSLALSICSSSSGIATFLAPRLITGSIASAGLSRTFFYNAGIMFFLVIGCALVIVDDPRKMDLCKYGAGEETGKTESRKKKTGTISKTNWVLLYSSIFLMGGLSGCALAVLPLIATSQGYNSTQMATAVSLAGISLLIGKLLYGILCEKITQFRSVMLYGLIMITGLVLLCFSSVNEYILYAGSILYVGTLAMIAIGLVSWVTDWLPNHAWQSARQRFMVLFNVGALVFSIIPGVLADANEGSYMPTVHILLFESVFCLAVLFLTYCSSRK